MLRSLDGIHEFHSQALVFYPYYSKTRSGSTLELENEQTGWLRPVARLLPGTSKEFDMEIKRNGSRPSQKGPEEYFTGTVRVDPLIQAPEPSRVTAGCVTFEPGARSAWHTHPLGQTLIVTSGLGWTQCWGDPVEEIRHGDVLWCPPGVKHWHGASPKTAMSHIAVTELLNGKNVDWLEKVTDEQYLAGPQDK
jgi:quercetin dioxygenase-like cupin family protein